MDAEDSLESKCRKSSDLYITIYYIYYITPSLWLRLSSHTGHLYIIESSSLVAGVLKFCKIVSILWVGIYNLDLRWEIFFRALSRCVCNCSLFCVRSEDYHNLADDIAINWK